MGEKPLVLPAKKQALNSKSLGDHLLSLIPALSFLFFFFLFHSLFYSQKTLCFEKKDPWSPALVTGYEKKEESQSITCIF